MTAGNGSGAAENAIEDTTRITVTSMATMKSLDEAETDAMEVATDHEMHHTAYRYPVAVLYPQADRTGV